MIPASSSKLCPFPCVSTQWPQTSKICITWYLLKMQIPPESEVGCCPNSGADPALGSRDAEQSGRLGFCVLAPSCFYIKQGHVLFASPSQERQF